MDKLIKWCNKNGYEFALTYRKGQVVLTVGDNNGDLTVVKGHSVQSVINHFLDV